MRIVWDIHYKCNYRCPYCWFENDLNARRFKPRPVSVREWVERWDYIYDKYGPAHIEITGGEPFIYDNFINLIGEISRRHTIRITTNLSFDIKRFISEINPGVVKIISSFHPSFAEEDVFLKKAAVLKEKGYADTVIYVAYPPQLRLVDYYKNKFEGKGIVFSVTPFCGIFNGLNYPGAYTDDEKKMLAIYIGEDKNRLKYTLNSESPKGKLCGAGQRSALLFEDGKLARCGPLKAKPFANLFDRDFEFLDGPKPCEADFCPCDDMKALEEA
ncbi:MAG: radical SAM protein [Candidatus Omnitrophota bacterium]